jgi:hypothetical protein
VVPTEPTELKPPGGGGGAGGGGGGGEGGGNSASASATDSESARLGGCTGLAVRLATRQPRQADGLASALVAGCEVVVGCIHCTCNVKDHRRQVAQVNHNENCAWGAGVSVPLVISAALRRKSLLDNS